MQRVIIINASCGFDSRPYQGVRDKSYQIVRTIERVYFIKLVISPHGSASNQPKLFILTIKCSSLPILERGSLHDTFYFHINWYPYNWTGNTAVYMYLLMNKQY